VSNGHAKLSPSASERWLECPASIMRAPDIEEEASEYALEGSAAHALAENCLIAKCDAWAGTMPIEYEKYVSPEMLTHVQGYLDYVRRHQGDGDLFVEQRLQIFPTMDVWGTADAVIVTDDGVIKVIDLKYGQGVLVDADENTQLLLYGIGALTLDWLSSVPVHAVEVHIYQPRRNNVVSKTYTVEELVMWVKENEYKVARAHAGTNFAVPGAHCKWCPVKGTCRERAEHNLKMAAFDFAAAEPVCADKDSLSEEELVKIFLNIPNFRNWLDSIEAEVAGRAHKGPVAGVKWVAGRTARRITNQELAVINLRGVGIEPLAEPKLLGITELEKLVKAKGLKMKDVLGDYIEVIPGKPALVAETDKRPALDRDAAAAEVFQNA
jgi:Protein of unknown function (DUF2800)